MLFYKIDPLFLFKFLFTSKLVQSRKNFFRNDACVAIISQPVTILLLHVRRKFNGFWKFNELHLAQCF